MPEGDRGAQGEFVNPYTFVQVPWGEPEAGWRSSPAGHGRLARGRLSGCVEVELTARSPLLLRNVYADADAEGAFPTRVLPGFEEPVPYLPGSSLAGAVRSLHETLAGGCLRVFNNDFRPGYRDQVQQRPPGWRLARVAEVDEDGVPLRMEQCPEPPVWVESAALEKALDGGADAVRTGARVTLKSRGEEVLKRQQLEDASQVRGGGDWVVLLTDAGTRHQTRKNPEGGDRLRGRYFCATGELEGTIRDVEFSGGVWESFLDAVDDTDDMRKFRQQPGAADDEPKWEPVLHPKDDRLLGQRIAARRRLYVNQVVWVRSEVTGETLTVKDMALAVVWRHAGGVDKARDRVPEHVLACTDPEELCPSCRIFGSADTKGDGGQRPAEQHSYRGHLRFGDAVPAKAYSRTQEWLPPMGAPKPGAGQFYLHRNSGAEGKTSAENGARPLREWGSEGDGKKQRGLRGRKQYWLTGTPRERPYFRAREAKPKVFHEEVYEPGNQMLSQAESVPAGSVFTARVHFENLDDAELGGLLCALEPGLLLRTYGEADGEGQPPVYGWAVGGGRPLGFGTVTSRVTLNSLGSAASRYLGEAAPSLKAEDAVAAFRRSAPKELTDIWKRQLTKVLRLDWAAPHQVWYPPAGLLPEPGKPFNPKALLPSFTFWKETTGGRTEDATFPYRQLPATAAPNPAMEVIPEEGE